MQKYFLKNSDIYRSMRLLCFRLFPLASRLLFSDFSSRLPLSWVTAAVFENIEYTNTATPVASWSRVPCVPQLRVVTLLFPLLTKMELSARNAVVYYLHSSPFNPSKISANARTSFAYVSCFVCSSPP